MPHASVPFISGAAARRRRTRDTRVSLLILAVLAVMLVLLWRMQSRLNPAVMVALGLVAPTADSRGEDATSPPLPFSVPPDFVPLGPVETFDPVTLADKIDGKAELYLSAGFDRLTAQRWRPASDSPTWVEISVYDMADPEAAFSVYSLQRRDDARSVPGLDQAYATENALFLHRDRRYVEMIAASSGDPIRRALVTLAEAFDAEHPVASDPPATKPEDLFPETGLAADSVRRIPTDAFGYSGLDRVLTATFPDPDGDMTAFLSRRDTPEAALRLRDAFAAFLTEFGAVRLERPEAVPGAVVLDVFGYVDVLFTHGPYLAGVREAATPEAAEALAGRLKDRFERMPDDR